MPWPKEFPIENHQNGSRYTAAGNLRVLGRQRRLIQIVQATPAKEEKDNMRNKMRWIIVLSLAALVTVGSIGGMKFSARAKTVRPRQNQTTTVPFKGLIARTGSENLILRIYDQNSGGKMLF